MLYRVTMDVDPDIAEEWLAWMRAVHVPDVLRAPGFLEATIAREDAGRFVIDYLVEGRSSLERYFAEVAPRLRAEHEARYAGRARAGRQVLDVVATLRPVRLDA